MERATERAIALGKTGELSDALAVLEPHLSQPSPASAKVCYVAGFLLKERYKRDALKQPKIAAVDRADAVRWLQLSLELERSGRDESGVAKFRHQGAEVPGRHVLR